MEIVLITITLIFIVITIFTLYFALSPKVPTFSIMHVVVTSPKSSSHLEYDIYLKTKNENSRTGIYYETDENVTLLLGRKNVGESELRTLYQQGSSFTTVRLIVGSFNGGSGYYESKIWRNEILVDCKFMVSALRTEGGSKLFSQECEATFKP